MADIAQEETPTQKKYVFCSSLLTLWPSRDIHLYPYIKKNYGKFLVVSVQPINIKFFYLANFFSIFKKRTKMSQKLGNFYLSQNVSFLLFKTSNFRSDFKDLMIIMNIYIWIDYLFQNFASFLVDLFIFVVRLSKVVKTVVEVDPCKNTKKSYFRKVNFGGRFHN